jgi:hypothetical protein
MGILVLNGDRIVLNGDTVSLGGPDIAGTANLSLAPPALSAAGAVAQLPIHGAATLDLAAPELAGGGQILSRGAGFAILQGIVLQGAGAVIIPADPPIDWDPPLVLEASALIGQALRFMRLHPIARFAPDTELRPALQQAFDSAMDDCLAACDWSFASTLARLPGAALPQGVTADDALPTTCQLPGDLVRIQSVLPVGARWRIDGARLRSEAAAPITIRYTARVSREEVLPASFKTAVALHIAARLAARWAGSGAEPESLLADAVRTLRRAMREDGRTAAAERILDAPDLGYGGDADWAHEAMA